MPSRHRDRTAQLYRETSKCDTTCDAQIQQCCPNASFPRRVVRIQNSRDYFLGTVRLRILPEKIDNSPISTASPPLPQAARRVRPANMWPSDYEARFGMHRV